MNAGEGNIFFWFCDSNQIFISKFSMEPCPPMSYELVVHRKEGHIFLYHIPDLVGDQSEMVV